MEVGGSWGRSRLREEDSTLRTEDGGETLEGGASYAQAARAAYSTSPAYAGSHGCEAEECAAGVLRSLGEGGHASAGFAEDTKGTTAVKPWGSTHNMRTNVGTERVCCHELNPSVQQILQQDSKIHEMVEGLPVGFEFDEKIDVAVNALFPLTNEPKSPSRRTPNDLSCARCS